MVATTGPNGTPRILLVVLPFQPVLDPKKQMDIALFSPSSLFDADDDASDDEGKTGAHQSYEERRHQFPGMPEVKNIDESCSKMFPSSNRLILMPVRTYKDKNILNELLIREFSFHQLNANLLWPGTFQFAEWLIQHRSWIEGRHCIELGSGTGALAIFLRRSFNLDITTSDYNDQEIEDNIAHNCLANGITPVLPHVKHSWGDTFPAADPDWDLVIASDILLYVKQYPNLIRSLCFLLNSYKPKDNKAVPLGNEQGLPWPAFLMSWRRRIGREDESLFFSGCENAGLEVKHLGSRVYCISPKANSPNKLMGES